MKNNVVADTTPRSESSYSASWNRGFSGLVYDTYSYYSPKHIVIDTPISTPILESSSIDSSSYLGKNTEDKTINETYTNGSVGYRF